MLIPLGQRVRDDPRHALQIEWLHEIVEGAGVDRPHGGVEITEGCHHHDWCVRDDAAQFGQRGEAVAAWKTDIEQHRLRLEAATGLEPRLDTRRHLHGVAFVGEHLAQAPADGGLVVDDEDAAHRIRVGAGSG